MFRVGFLLAALTSAHALSNRLTPAILSSRVRHPRCAALHSRTPVRQPIVLSVSPKHSDEPLPATAFLRQPIVLSVSPNHSDEPLSAMALLAACGAAATAVVVAPEPALAVAAAGDTLPSALAAYGHYLGLIVVAASLTIERLLIKVIA